MSKVKEKDSSNPTSASISPPSAEIKDSSSYDIAHARLKYRDQTTEHFLIKDSLNSTTTEAQPSNVSFTKAVNDGITSTSISSNKPIKSTNDTTNMPQDDFTSTKKDITDASEEKQKKAESESFNIIKRSATRIAPDRDELDGIEKWE